MYGLHSQREYCRGADLLIPANNDCVLGRESGHRVFFRQRIPSIALQIALIEEIQTDQWWEGVTVSLLEFVRRRLRNPVPHIEKMKKAVVHSNFADEVGERAEHELPQVGEADFARFKQKARHLLRAHQDHLVLHKLRQGKPSTTSDLNEREKGAARRQRRQC